jgi:hypothetical protein
MTGRPDVKVFGLQNPASSTAGQGRIRIDQQIIAAPGCDKKL